MRSPSSPGSLVAPRSFSLLFALSLSLNALLALLILSFCHCPPQNHQLPRTSGNPRARSDSLTSASQDGLLRRSAFSRGGLDPLTSALALGQPLQLPENAEGRSEVQPWSRGELQRLLARAEAVYQVLCAGFPARLECAPPGWRFASEAAVDAPESVIHRPEPGATDGCSLGA